MKSHFRGLLICLLMLWPAGASAAQSHLPQFHLDRERQRAEERRQAIQELQRQNQRALDQQQRQYEEQRIQQQRDEINRIGEESRRSPAGRFLDQQLFDMLRR